MSLKKKYRDIESSIEQDILKRCIRADSAILKM